MATATFFTPVNMDDQSTAEGFITAKTANLVRIDNDPVDPTLRQEYTGNFTLNANGDILGGTLTGFSELSRTTVNDPVVQTTAVTGFNHDVIQAATLLGQGNVANFNAFLYSGNDTFTGSSGNDILRSFAGNDRINAGAGNDNVDGGAGIDTAVFSGARAGSTLTATGTGYTVTGTDGTDTLTAVERLAFSDRNVAIDLGAGQSGNNAARIIGATFGANTIAQQPDYMGIALQLFDQGLSMQQVAQLALGTQPYLAQVGGNSTNAAFVNEVYENVVGAAPSAGEAAFYTGLLQGSGGTMTQAELLTLAANADANAARINLTGLQQTGFDFVV